MCSLWEKRIGRDMRAGMCLHQEHVREQFSLVGVALESQTKVSEHENLKVTETDNLAVPLSMSGIL